MTRPMSWPASLRGEYPFDPVKRRPVAGADDRDTAMLSSSPVVLIDEIENAGVDRKKALELLVREEKMVLMSTHDPLLALMGDRRLVIENGGVKAVIETSDRERSNLYELERIDRRMQELRNQIRTGSRVEYPVAGFFHLEG